MKTKKWKFTVKKSKSKNPKTKTVSYYASAKHGNDKPVIYMKGYNQKATLIKEIKIIMPSAVIVDATGERK